MKCGLGLHAKLMEQSTSTIALQSSLTLRRVKLTLEVQNIYIVFYFDNQKCIFIENKTDFLFLLKEIVKIKH